MLGGIIVGLSGLPYTFSPIISLIISIWIIVVTVLVSKYLKLDVLKIVNHSIKSFFVLILFYTILSIINITTFNFFNIFVIFSLSMLGNFIQEYIGCGY